MPSEYIVKIERLGRRVARERSARKEAEDLLEKKSLEVFEVNQNLTGLNETLEARVFERTIELEVERAKAVDLAERDYLTQLANRLAFAKMIETAVEDARRGNHPFALMLVDLDDFKLINDTYGHPAGDAVLKAVAQRLQAIVGSRGFVFRMGGDEFAVLLSGQVEPEFIEDLATRLISSVQAPIQFGSQELFCGASVGIANCPQHANTSDELLAFADMALYEAKAIGRGVVVYFEAGMGKNYKRQRELGDDLETVLMEGGIDVFFQPVVNLRDRSFIGAEALLRWKHPKLGWVNPLDILNVAKERNLLALLSRQIIETSLKKASCSLQHHHLEWISINLSDYDLRDKELSDFILNVCEDTGVNPNQLKVELTEHTLVSDMDATHRIMKNLNDEGVKFAVDDFGTGYSNLLSLKRLPFHTLKIDQTFMVDLFAKEESRTIVKAMIDLAHSLNLEVVAEGVETIQQSEVLSALGCDFAQGYLFGRPNSNVPGDEQSVSRSAAKGREEFVPLQSSLRRTQ